MLHVESFPGESKPTDTQHNPKEEREEETVRKEMKGAQVMVCICTRRSATCFSKTWK